MVNSSVNYYKKSKFLQAWVLKFSANVQARSSVVWFLKQSKQMCLLQSPQATLHHVSLFPLNSAYSDLWRTSRCPELVDNCCDEKFAISNVTRSNWKASWVLDRWCEDSFTKICVFTIARGNATTAFDHWSLHRPCCCCMSSQLGCWELESLLWHYCLLTVLFPTGLDWELKK